MRARRWRIRSVVLVVAAAALVLSACGGGDDADEGDEDAVGAAEEDSGAESDDEGEDDDEEPGDGVLLEDDFSDPDSGFETFSDELNTIAYEDGGLRFDLLGNASTGLPIDGPLPDSGSITVTVEGDLTPGYAGICLAGDTGQYEFAIAPGGYASLGYYTETTGDFGEFDLIDEARDAYGTTGTHEVRARWRSEGGATDLAIDVDGETIVTTNDDDRVTEFTFATLCATVGSEAEEGAVLTVVYDDLTVSEEG